MNAQNSNQLTVSQNRDTQIGHDFHLLIGVFLAVRVGAIASYVRHHHVLTRLQHGQQLRAIVFQAVGTLHLMYSVDVVWANDYSSFASYLAVNDAAHLQIVAQQVRCQALECMLVRQVTCGFAEGAAEGFTIRHHAQSFLTLAKFARHQPAFARVFYSTAQGLRAGPILANIVLGASTQYAPPVFPAGTAGEHDHRAYRHTIRPGECGQHFGCLHVWQVVVKHHAVR